MKKGRYLSIFLPVITGLILVVASALSFTGSSFAGDWQDDGYDCEESYEYSVNDWDDDDWDDCDEPTPTPDPCVNEEPIGFWNFLNIDVEAYREYPSPTPCPTPTPTPEASPSPTPFNPPVGGGDGGNGGSGQAPQCPVDGKPQDIDKVWVSDVTATSLIVHWANKGDATGFQIAYGPENNKTQWGIKVNDGKANSFTITGIPENLKVSVSVTPVNGDCGGNTSEATTVLASTGLVKSLSSLLGGFGLVTLGLWQAQRAAFSKRAKKVSK